MPRSVRRTPKPGRSRQRKHGGGSFSSERQRRFMWANYPRAAKKWAHNRHTNKSHWVRSPKGRGGGVRTVARKSIPGTRRRRARVHRR
jgi:hypothetical protein